MALSYMSKLGFTKEASYGAGGSPTVMLPVAPFSFTVPFEQLLDDNLRGIVAKDYAAYQGTGRVEGSLEGPFYPEEVGFWLLGILAAVSTSGTADPYTHTFSFASSPPSFSFTDDNPVQNYEYRGAMLSEFGLTFNAAEGLLTWTLSFIGKDRTKVTYGPPTETTNAPFRGWMTKASLGGTVVDDVIEGEITISREVTPQFTATASQFPDKAYAGVIEVTGRLTLRFEADSDIDRYFNKAQEAVELSWEYGTAGQPGHKKLVFSADKMDFGEGPVEIDRTGTFMTLAYSMRALYNTAQAGSCRFTLINSKSGY